VIPPAAIGAMSSNRVILGELLSSRARLRFPRPTLILLPQLPLVGRISANGIQGLLQASHPRGSPAPFLVVNTLCSHFLRLSGSFNKR
jgi:hypothetical protein